MKKPILIAIALICLSPLTYGQGWVNVELPVTGTVTGISFPTPDTGYVITNDGMLARTWNGAKNWQLLTVERNAFLEDVDFVNSKVGVICARKGVIFHTMDGGNTWEKWSSGDSVDYLSSVHLHDQNTGIAVGLHKSAESPMLPATYRTVDGGRSWSKLPIEGLGFAEVFEANKKLYMLSFGTLHVSTDLGRTWRSMPTTEGEAGRAIDIHGKTGIIGGGKGMRAISSDSGKTWQLLTGSEDGIFIAAALVNDSLGYMGGYPSLLYVTNDAGKSWKRELPARQFDVLDMCVAGNRIYVVGGHGGMVYKQVR